MWPIPVVILTATFLAGCMDSKDICSDRVSAYSAIKDEVSRNLVSPSTAIFPDVDNPEIKWGKTPQGKCSISIDNTYVDSPNRFGALVRIRYAAVASYGKAGTEGWETIFAPSGDTFGATID
jgi:hypothetical protein